MNPSLSLCYIPGFGHNWMVPHGEEHRFIPALYQKRLTHTSLSVHYLRWGGFNPSKNHLDSIGKYQEEEVLAADTSNLKRLESSLQIMQPEIIVCHSLGARLLYHAATKGISFGSVRKIVLLQPDIPVGYDMSRLKETLSTQGIDLIYTWCPWDDTLGMVSFFAQELRLGQAPFIQGLSSQFNPLIPRIGKTWHTQILDQDITHLFS